ncbi:MAG: DUF4157 domain-containing protein [Chitinophagaceae bacterium]|nr:DUF4157 domain-containing protein [Chitinophagaceae bacterium]
MYQNKKRTGNVNTHLIAVTGKPGKGALGLLDNRPKFSVQRKQLNTMPAADAPVVQQKANKTGLPDNLKSGIENISGNSMDDVKVHYNSDKPAQLSAHAYAQGTDIHIAPGQEKQLQHEAWHVVQQKQGRVKPTMQMKGKVNVNDDKGLEKEADMMGAKADKIKVQNSDARHKDSTFQFKPVTQLIKFSDTQQGLINSREINVNSIKLDTVLVLANVFPDSMDEDSGEHMERHVNFWNGTQKYVSLTPHEIHIVHNRATGHKQYLDKKVAENPNTLLAFPGNLQLRHERLSDKNVRKANRIAGLIRQKYSMNPSAVITIRALEDYVLRNINPVPVIEQVIYQNDDPVVPLKLLEFNKFLISMLRNFDGMNIPGLGHLEQIVERQERTMQGHQFKKVIAHRGDGATFDKMGGLLPRDDHNHVYQHENENSFASTQKAMESWSSAFSSLSGIECDVYLTNDNVPIVTHTSNLQALLAQESRVPYFSHQQSDIRAMLVAAIHPRFMRLYEWLALIEQYVRRKEQQFGIFEQTTGKLRIEIEMKQSIMTDLGHQENWLSTEKIVSQFLKQSAVSHLMDIALFNNSNVPAARDATARKKTMLSQVTYAKGGAPDPALKEVRFGMHQKGISAHINSGALDNKIVTFAPGLDHPGHFQTNNQLLPVHGLPTQLDVTIEQSIQSARHRILTGLMQHRKQSGVGMGPTAIHTLTDHGNLGAWQINLNGLHVANSLTKPPFWTTNAIIAKHPELTDGQIRNAVDLAKVKIIPV